MNVCNSKGWLEVVNPEVLNVEPQPLGPRHCPVKHSTILDMFTSKLAESNIVVAGQKGLLSPDGLKYIHVADIKAGNDAGDYNYTLGFVNFNNRQKRFLGLYGEKVFVCSNETFRGSTVDTTRKHTIGFLGVLHQKIEILISNFNQFVEKRGVEIASFKQIKFTDDNVGRVILNALRDDVIGNANIQRIVEEWDRPRHQEFGERTAWSFQNAVTEVLKNVSNPLQKVKASECFLGHIRREVGQQQFGLLPNEQPTIIDVEPEPVNA